jgi:hypothetical protein
MPKFYFHVQTVNGGVEEDTIGAEFDNEQQAIMEAKGFARDLMHEAAAHGETVEHVIEVIDEAGHIIVRLQYRATVQDGRPQWL